MSFISDPGSESSNLFPGSSSSKKKRKKRRKKKTTQRSSSALVTAAANNSSVMSKLMAVKKLTPSTFPSLTNQGQSHHLRTRWDVSAQALLKMTLTFLRHVPEVFISTHLKKPY
jgi:hypothetical protein